ncbi:MAG: 8-amino-7-oxononanoate synthase [Planctomycetaceae bacterium]
MALDWLDDALEERRQAACSRSPVRAAAGRRVVRGRWSPAPQLRAGNDYLGLAGDTRLQAAAVAAIESAGSRASMLVSGRGEWHARLEQRLAMFHHAEAALLFPTGYAANVGTIGALVGSGDVVLCDRLNHASLIDGCRLSGAKLRVYPHGDVADAARQLHATRDARRRLVVTDSVFSMDGDLAKLAELAEACRSERAMLLVDEAHATGVYGPGGRGLTEALQGHDTHIIKVGTLSKALAGQGGYVVGSQTLIDWLFNLARTQMFSTALTPAACASALAALDIVAAEPWRREHLRDLSRRLRSTLSHAGIETGGDLNSPIVPIVVGDADRVVALGKRLEDRGCLVATIRPPTVPRGTSRLRVSLSAAHSQADVDLLVQSIRASWDASPG